MTNQYSTRTKAIILAIITGIAGIVAMATFLMSLSNHSTPTLKIIAGGFGSITGLCVILVAYLLRETYAGGKRYLFLAIALNPGMVSVLASISYAAYGITGAAVVSNIAAALMVVCFAGGVILLIVRRAC